MRRGFCLFAPHRLNVARVNNSRHIVIVFCRIESNENRRVNEVVGECKFQAAAAVLNYPNRALYSRISRDMFKEEEEAYQF
jgi:hypothetical protein